MARSIYIYIIYAILDIDEAITDAFIDEIWSFTSFFISINICTVRAISHGDYFHFDIDRQAIDAGLFSL